MKFKIRFLGVLLFTIGLVVNSGYAMDGYVPPEAAREQRPVVINDDPLKAGITRTIAIGRRMQVIFDALAENFDNDEYRGKAHAELEALSTELEAIRARVEAATHSTPTITREMLEVSEPTSFWVLIRGLILCLDNYRSLEIEVVRAREQWLFAHIIDKTARGDWPMHGIRIFINPQPLSAGLRSSFARLLLLVGIRDRAADAIFTGRLYLQDELDSRINKYKADLAAIMQRHVANINRIMGAGSRGWDGPPLSFLMLSYDEQRNLESTITILETLVHNPRLLPGLRENMQALIAWGRYFLNLNTEVARRLIFLAQASIDSSDERYSCVLARLQEILGLPEPRIITDTTGEIRTAAFNYHRLLTLFFQARQNLAAQNIIATNPLLRLGRLTQQLRLVYQAKGQYFNSLLSRL